MNAVISGRAGIALLIEGEALHSFHVARPDTLVRRDQSELPWLFGAGADLQYLNDVTFEDTQRALEFAHQCAGALDMALITLDAGLSFPLRKAATDRLEELLIVNGTGKYIESIFYAQPLAANADLPGTIAARVASGAMNVEGFLNDLLARQPYIDRVRQGWEAISSDLFADSWLEREEFERYAIRSGLFRSLVINLARRKGLVGFIERSLPNAEASRHPRYLEVLPQWLKAIPARPRRKRRKIQPVENARRRRTKGGAPRQRLQELLEQQLPLGGAEIARRLVILRRDIKRVLYDAPRQLGGESRR